MKTIRKVSIILAVIFFASLIICILTGPIMIFSGFESASINQSEKVQMAGINSLDVDVPDPDISIYPVEGNEFQINLHGTYAKNDFPEPINLSVEKTGDSIKVGITPQIGMLVLINKDIKLDIGVPKSYSGNMIISSVSGEVKVGNLNVNSLKAKTVSGEISIINSTSRREFTANSVSGEIYLENIKSENIQAESVSGKIQMISSENITSAKTTSGEIEISNSEVNNDIAIKTVSGEVSLELAQNSSIKVKFDSVSGDLENNFGDISGGNKVITVKTTSGNLVISKNN